MAEYRRIEYIIAKDGKVTERVIEGKGADCLDAGLAIESSLGEVEHRELLPEYDQDPNQILIIGEPNSLKLG
ncbi:MAG: DUF2997 domain-containing protein [Pseudanabaenaceae cyanobacterium bins.68]|nr:DUF2997 domain-containing protein [Pseudanabaenaceae cyanobacterium bins.68]